MEFCAAIPVLTITGSFGVPVDQALDVRESLSQPDADRGDHRPDRRGPPGEPEDDLISVLVEAEITDEDGETHRLSDAGDLLVLPAAAGRRFGHDLEADGHHAGRPAAAARAPRRRAADRSLLRPAIEESVRWQPTDPMFSRWVTEDTEFFGTQLPKGSVLHICLGAANRDPDRWERPDEYDPFRPPQAHVGLRRRAARLPRAARGPGRDDGRHQRPAGPAPQSQTRPRCRTTRRSSASTSGAPPPFPSYSD